MSEVNDPTPPANAAATPSGTPGEAARAGDGAATPTESKPTEPKPSAAMKLRSHPKVQQALAMAKTHPLGAVATVAAAAALVEVEFAVGILTGLGATALLASRSGPEARERVIARGKQALAQARFVMAKRKKSPAAATSAPSDEAAPPPAE